MIGSSPSIDSWRRGGTPGTTRPPASNTSDACGATVYVLRFWHVEFGRSAFKHGCSVDEIMHAVATAVVVIDLDADADPPMVLAIGADQSGRWLEVIWLRFGDRDVVIQPMSLRKVFREFLERGEW